jgi:hypothetical protein
MTGISEPKRTSHRGKEDIDVTERRIHERWDEYRQALDAGIFWADEIKAVRNQPKSRLDLAIKNLPLPAAFREAAIALRSIIRENKAAGADWSAWLRRLYGLAALESFFFATDYVAEVNVPAYSVAEVMPREEWPSLTYDYNLLGYRKLRLLNKTDRKWLVEQRGEPITHTTLRDIERGRWVECVERFRQLEERRSEKLIVEMKRDLRDR